VSEPDDYLFDPQAPVDPEVAALERALAPLRAAPGPWRGQPPLPTPARGPRRWPLWLGLAGAAAFVALWLTLGRGERLAPASPARQFVAGATDVEIPFGDVGAVTLGAGSELEFVHWRADQLLLRLVRGRLEARVAPPPRVVAGFFQVDTPMGRVVDQGCRYELVVHDARRAQVRVTEGAVTFAGAGRTVFVPAGATAAVVDGRLGTPSFVDSAPELRKAAGAYDRLAGTPDAKVVEERRVARERIAALVRVPRDSLVLWHLLADAGADAAADDAARALVEARLRALVGPPREDGAARHEPAVWLGFLREAVWTGGG
jgi:hypothetical protein